MMFAGGKGAAEVGAGEDGGAINSDAGAGGDAVDLDETGLLNATVASNKETHSDEQGDGDDKNDCEDHRHFAKNDADETAFFLLFAFGKIHMRLYYTIFLVAAKDSLPDALKEGGLVGGHGGAGIGDFGCRGGDIIGIGVGADLFGGDE